MLHRRGRLGSSIYAMGSCLAHDPRHDKLLMLQALHVPMHFEKLRTGMLIPFAPLRMKTSIGVTL